MKVSEIKSETLNQFSEFQILSFFDRSDFYSRDTLSIERLNSSISQFLLRNPTKPLVLYLSSGCYQAENALEVVKLIKEYRDNYSVIVPKRLGSFATILSLGANKIYMTRQSALSTIDACLSGHDYPFVVNNLIRRQINPAELSSLNDFIRNVLAEDDESIAKVYRVVEEFIPLDKQDKAEKRYQFLKSKLLEIVSEHNNLLCPRLFIDYLLLDAGSFDYWLDYSDLKCWGLSVELCSHAEEALIWKIEESLKC